MTSSHEGDWTREQLAPGEYAPGKRLLRCLRQHELWRKESNPVTKRIMMRWIVYRHRFWSAICGADIPFNENIGPGLAMPHPNGVVIHSNAIIGANCTIYQQTTIGRNHRIGEPVIGNEVIIGAGAKILGSVTIGDGARIGANSVVLDDVAAGETVVGIPARPVARR